jgi:hypothetical protein
MTPFLSSEFDRNGVNGQDFFVLEQGSHYDNQNDSTTCAHKMYIDDARSLDSLLITNPLDAHSTKS